MPRGFCSLAEILLPCLSPVGRHHLTHPRRVGVASTRHTSLSLFPPVCASYACLLPPSLLSLVPLLSSRPTTASSRPGSARAHSGGVTGPSTRQPAASSLSPAPRLGSPVRAPVQFDHLVTSPSSRPGLRPPDPEGASSSRPHSGRAHASPALTGPDPMASPNLGPLYTRPRPPALATGPNRLHTYRPAQAIAVSHQKPIVVVLEAPADGSYGLHRHPARHFEHGPALPGALDQPRYKSASEPASTAPIACLQRRTLFAYSLVERHSTAPIAAVLPED